VDERRQVRKTGGGRLTEKDVRSKVIVVAAASAAVVALAAWGVWRLAFDDTATPVSASRAVEEASATTGPAPATTGATVAPGGFVVGTAPGDPGLYVYNTSGFEEIDALGGARHDYPARTFLTIQPGGCGVVVRWTALDERWDETELCPSAGGYTPVRYAAYHEWFGRPDLQSFSCGPEDALAVPPGAEGEWTYQCDNEERTEVWDVFVAGAETLTVGGIEVPAVRVRVESVLAGSSEGSSTTETWYLEGTPLVLRRIVERNSANASLIGSVSYHESYEITLTSPAPSGGETGP
jgi:hypothetical protein